MRWDTRFCTAIYVIIFFRFLQPFWNLLIGFPGETEEIYANYDRILPTLTHLPPPSGVYPVRFDRFSPYFKDADAYGLDLAPMDFYSLVYPELADDDLRELAYFFVDRNFAAAYIQAASAWLAPLARRISAWQDAWKSERPLLVAVEEAHGSYILDTRSGLELRHPVSPDGAAILQQLRTPLTLERIAGKLPTLPIEVLERQVEELRSRGLLFCEDARFLSLISSAAQEEETL